MQKMKEKFWRIKKDAEIPFHNNVDYCIGTGRMGLALQKEYQDQLELVQKEIGFSHIRGHGLFSDDMAIYQEYTDSEGKTHAEYNFTYLDRVMDAYQRLGLEPFLELGFMPKKLASGEQTVFYWKGNVTPPRSWNAWCDLTEQTLRHLMERYGVEKVVTWPIEVWNEPNLPGFWKDADMEAYFHLFQVTFERIKKLDSRFQVGGPAICGVEDEKWIRCFLEFCRSKNLKPDFITRHHYTTDFPVMEGHYGYAALTPAEEGFANLQTTRDIINSFPEYRGMEIHITEFNTSYIPNCPLHDTNQNAAYLAEQLSRLGDVNESYSYWTFGDVFEEQGVPFTPFHGGFGLVADGCIPKPTFWTFQFFKNLQGTCVHRSKEAVVVRTVDGIYKGTAWNKTMTGKGEKVHIRFAVEEAEGTYCLLTKTVDEKTCNPLKLWHDMGEPSSLSEEQKKLLQEVSRPFIESRRMSAEKACQVDENDGALNVELELEPNGVVYFELRPVSVKSDRGYCYEKVMGE